MATGSQSTYAWTLEIRSRLFMKTTTAQAIDKSTQSDLKSWYDSSLPEPKSGKYTDKKNFEINRNITSPNFFKTGLCIPGRPD